MQVTVDGFWTNPLVVVGEPPCLSQTGYKAYSYSPWDVITLSRIRDANWHLPRVTYVSNPHPTIYGQLVLVATTKKLQPVHMDWMCLDHWNGCAWITWTGCA